MFFSAGVTGGGGADVPRGEATYVNSTSWVCPPGVTSVCVVLVGRGGNGVGGSGYYVSGGGGGALVYKNNVAVVPGTSYPMTVSSSTSSAFGLSAGAGGVGYIGSESRSGSPGIASTGGSPDGAFNGGSGATYSGSSEVAVGGGNAATYTAPGTNNGRNAGIGVRLDGISGVGQYGGGGRSIKSGYGQPSLGQSGAIRIIWGSGRSFPDNAV